MKLNYYPETDTLYIDLSECESGITLTERGDCTNFSPILKGRS